MSFCHATPGDATPTLFFQTPRSIFKSGRERSSQCHFPQLSDTEVMVGLARCRRAARVMDIPACILTQAGASFHAPAFEHAGGLRTVSLLLLPARIIRGAVGARVGPHRGLVRRRCLSSDRFHRVP